MYMEIYSTDGTLIADGDVSTPNSTLASSAVIDRAVGLGYDVECEGNLYHSPTGQTGRRANASIITGDAALGRRVK